MNIKQFSNKAQKKAPLQFAPMTTKNGGCELYEKLIRSGRKIQEFSPLLTAPGTASSLGDWNIFIIDSPNSRVLTKQELEKRWAEGKYGFIAAKNCVFFCAENISLDGDFNGYNIYACGQDIFYADNTACFRYPAVGFVVKKHNGDIDLVTPFFNDDLYAFGNFLNTYVPSDYLDACLKKQIDVFTHTYSAAEIEEFVNAIYRRKKHVNRASEDGYGSMMFIDKATSRLMQELIKKVEMMKTYEKKIKDWTP